MHRWTPTRIKRVNSLIRAVRHSKLGKVNSFDLDETLCYIAEMAVNVGAMKREQDRYGNVWFIPIAEIETKEDTYDGTIEPLVLELLEDSYLSDSVPALRKNCKVEKGPRKTEKQYTALFDELELVES